MNFLTEIPRDILHLILLYLDDPTNLITLLQQSKIKIKNYIWEYLYSLKFPDEYKIIKDLMKIDYTLQAERYTKNWRELFIDDTLLTPEIELLNIAIELKKEFPQFYEKSLKLPNTLYTKKYLYNTLAKIDDKIVDENIKDQNFIDYFETGILNSQLTNTSVHLDLEIILFMLIDGLIIGDNFYHKIVKAISLFNSTSNFGDDMHDYYNEKLIKLIFKQLSEPYYTKLKEVHPGYTE
jgi:hypothetical protein